MKKVERKFMSINALVLRTIGVVLACLAWPVYSAMLDLSDLPLFIGNNVPPNIVVTLDDSGSMARGWLPEENGDDNSEKDANYYRSSHYNKIYYNPQTTYVPPLQSTGVSEPNADFNAAVRGIYFVTGRGTRDLATEFQAIDEQEAGRQADFVVGCGSLCQQQAAYYFEYHGSSVVDALCNGATEQDNLVIENCYRKVVIPSGMPDSEDYSGAGGTNSYGRTEAEEKTNFANWYQYYAIRNDAAKTAIFLSFSPQSVNESVRLGRQTLNDSPQIQSGARGADVNGISELTPTERANFYEWIKGVGGDDTTPLRKSLARVGEFFTDEDPYRIDPQNNLTDVLSCRANTHLLVTDGEANGDLDAGDVSGALRSDDSATTFPDGTAYSPTSSEYPIYPNPLTTDSLADLAFHYWSTDLLTGPTGANNVVPFYVEKTGVNGEPAPEDYWNPRNDPATWQHLVNYVVSFGVTGSIPTTDAVYQALLAGDSYTANDGSTQTGWPASVKGTPGIVDDTYHAAINGRGSFFNVTDPDELVNAFGSVTDRIAELRAKASAAASNSGRISSDNLVYLASFDTEKWLGQLQAFEVSDGTGFVPGAAQVDCNDRPFGEFCGEVWDAAVKNTANSIDFTTRKVFTYNDTSLAGASPAGNGTDFKWPSLNAVQQTLLDDGDGLGDERVDYLRGDGSDEIDSGGMFKSRVGIPGSSVDTRVGPLVHTTPAFVGNGFVGAGVRQFDFPDNLESASYSAFLASIASRPSVVYAGSGDGMLHAYDAGRGANGGKEIFSYVPNAVMADLHELTEPGFQSGAFVDGPLVVQDVFYTGSWHTLLVGGLRSGGKGYFALDVTNPNANASAISRWEFTDHNDIDMGFSYGRAQLVRANNGKWVVIVSNGYNSTNEKAALFILDAADGRVLKKMVVDNSVGGGNGLSSPIAITADGDFNVDYVYAGDLKGNMWRFDLSSSNVIDWTWSKLYSTPSGQPITGAPAVGSHPANRDGRVVYFGTGQYIESNDASSNDAQYFYGILDDDSCVSKSAACVTGSLVNQSLSSAGNLRTGSDNPIDWQTNKGWRVSFGVTPGGASERVVSRPFVFGPVVVFLSLQPDSDPCNAGGDSFLYVLDRNNGGKTEFQILDTNNDGVVDNLDTSGGQIAVGFKLDLAFPAIEGSLYAGSGGKGSFNVAGEGQLLENVSKTGRVRWRQLK